MNLLSTAGSCSDMESQATFSVHDIGAYGSFMSSGAQRSLDLLRAIEQTLVAVQSICDQMASFRRNVRGLNASISALSEPVPEASTVAVFGDAQDALQKIYGHMQQRLAAAKRDPQLTEQDGVEAIYIAAIDEVQSLHDEIETLRWNLMHHNAMLDPSGGQELTSAEAVEAFLSGL